MRRRSLCADGLDLHESNPRSIVNADMDVLPTDAEVAIDHAGLSAGDAMPHRANAAELLDVDVDELTRVFALIAPNRFSGFQGIQLIQAEPPQNTTDSGWRDADLRSDLLSRPALAA